MDEELYHYGVKGMKWGVRKNPSAAYRKASKKATRLDRRVDKASKKLNKYTKKLNKAQRRFAGWGFSSNKNLLRQTKNVARWSRKLEKRTKKAEAWASNMRDAFASTKVSAIAEQDIRYGRNYVDMLMQD